MSDIDFDELDRAVNGAIGDNSTPAPQPTVNEAPVVPSVPSFNVVERTTVSGLSTAQTSVPASSPVPSTPTVSATPAARRSSGRFMDMVHPSSDMRSGVPTSRVENRPVPTPEIEPEVIIPEVAESPVWSEPLESPFLVDAKVEKRPLGGGEAPTGQPDLTVASFDFQGLLDEPDEPLLKAPEPQERIEATTMPDPIDFAAASAISDEIELKPFEAEKPVIIEESVVEPKSLTEAFQSVAEEPIGPTSITPQYKEQASAQQESGAMYDTESYHQAVSAPVKKKSGWFTVIMILLLVVLGAGGGWAVFTYILPML